MPAALPLRLGVNIDHVATIRNARGGRHPDPVRAAMLAIEAGADGITAHLREDRRHISDDDIARLKASIAKPLNLEMAATDEMVEIAVRTRRASSRSGARSAPPRAASMPRVSAPSLGQRSPSSLRQESGCRCSSRLTPGRSRQLQR